MAEHALIQRLEERVLLLDGGMGSQLIAMGLARGQAPEHWNLEHPDRIVQVHRGYAEAGSDVITANTFGANPTKLADTGLEGRCEEVNARAVELARAAADGALVAGDVGPTGALFPPMGEATTETLAAAFSEQTGALAAAGADLLIVETMYDLREALSAVRAAAATGLPVLASMTFERKKRGVFTIVGDRVGPSLEALGEAGADVVGINCSVGSAEMISMAQEAVGEIGRPLLVQPNAGQPRATPEGVVYDADPAQFVEHVMEMVRIGARVVGGCCGTDPAFISQLRRALDAP